MRRHRAVLVIVDLAGVEVTFDWRWALRYGVLVPAWLGGFLAWATGWHQLGGLALLVGFVAGQMFNDLEPGRTQSRRQWWFRVVFLGLLLVPLTLVWVHDPATLDCRPVAILCGLGLASLLTNPPVASPGPSRLRTNRTGLLVDP